MKLADVFIHNEEIKLPEWKHKDWGDVVQAAKIIGISGPGRKMNDGKDGTSLYLECKDAKLVVTVSETFMQRTRAKIGDYFVVTTWVAGAFEEKMRLL